jgi:lactoylglutathione lyase
LVVDDREAVRDALEANGIEILPGKGLDFRDPSGNRIEIVEYADIQFTKTDAALRSVGVVDGTKTSDAQEELRKKGLAP